MEIRALVIDDEYQGRNFLAKILNKLFPEMVVVGLAETIDDAVTLIQSKRPNLVFLDILMRNENGFDLFRKVSIDFEIIFTTAHDEFAVKAFRFNALDYLLKPIDLDELEQAIIKANTRLNSPYRVTPQQLDNLVQSVRSTTTPEKSLDKVAIPSSDGFVMVRLDDIVYCESNGNYTNFVLLNSKRLLSSYNLGQYEGMLGTQNFLRVHKSFLINIAHVERYIKGDGGSLIMSNGDTVEVARRNKDHLLRILKH